MASDSLRPTNTSFSTVSVTDEVASFDLMSLPSLAPESTASARDFRVFLDDLNVAFSALEMKKNRGAIAPVAARSLQERLTDLDRTVRAILSFIEV